MKSNKREEMGAYYLSSPEKGGGGGGSFEMGSVIEDLWNYLQYTVY